MTNARDKIPRKARALAKKVLERCDQERKSSPMDIFSEEIEKALLRELQAGIKVGRQVAAAEAMRGSAPSKN